MSTEMNPLPQHTLDDLEAPVVDLTEDEAEAVAGGLLPARGIAEGDGSVMPTDQLSLNYQKVKYMSGP